MTKLERLEQLFRGPGSPDHTLFRPILMHFAARFNNTTYSAFASDYRVLVESNIRALEYFDMDMVGLISDPYRETSAFGADIYFPEDHVPRCRAPVLKNLEDIRNLKIPDVYANERTLDRIRGARYFNQILKGQVPVIGWIEGPLALACTLTGVSQMLMQLMVDPYFSNSLLDKCMLTAKNFAKAQIEEGCQIIGIGDAICSQIDPVSYETFVKKRHKEIVSYIHEAGARVKLHICGDITHLLPSLKEVDMDILDLDWQVDLNEAWKIIGPDVVRCGNIDPVIVQSKSEEEIYHRSLQLIENEHGRRYVLSAGCEITVNTPVENLKAMAKASKQKITKS